MSCEQYGHTVVEDDPIKSPPACEPYEAMTRRLFNLFALNEYQRYEAILSLPLSGDMKPSKLMSSMLALLLPASLILWSSLCLSPSLP